MSKSQDELIDSTVSSSQCKLAIDALLKHALKHKSEKEQNALLPEKDQFVWLVLTTKKILAEKKLKPFRIPLAHPLIDPRTTAICLITKDPQREYKDLLESNNINFISRVVGIQKLKGKFKPFEARRMLLKENGLFLADERVVPLLPKLLGKPFFNAKKQPLPVCLTRKGLKSELENAVSSTYFHQNQGSCSSVKFGTVGFHDPTKLFNNLKTSLPLVVKSVKGGWDNIQSIHIKTNSSASLPIWSCELSDSKSGRWDGLTAVPVDAHDKEAEEKSEADMADETVVEMKGEKQQAAVDEEAVVTKKGKKRPVVTEEQPKRPKKAKVVAEEPKKPKKPTSKNHPSNKTAQTSHKDTTAAENPAIKKANKRPADASQDPPAAKTASKRLIPVSVMKDKEFTSPTKTKALASGIDKKKAKLTGQTTKSKLGQSARSVKTVLLKKKAAAP